MLYLLKGSRVREYHQQNLAVLGAAEGDSTEIIYNRRWVVAGVDLRPGVGAVIVFADSPYDAFVPVRFGVLEEVDETPERVRLVVKLGPFVMADGLDKLATLWSRFDRDDDDRPGKRFVLEDDNPDLTPPTSDTDLDDAWRACCAALRANGYFENSTIARIRKILDDRGLDVEAGGTVAAGSALHVEIETCTPIASRDHVELVVDADPPGAVAARSEQLPASGIATVTLDTDGVGPVRLRCSLLPEPARSSRPTFDLVLAGGQRAPEGVERLHGDDQLLLVPGVDLVRLVTQLRRDVEMSPSAWLSLFDDYFGAWGEREPKIVVAHARAAYDAGEVAVAYQLYQSIEPRSPADDLLYLFAGLRAGERVELDSLLATIDLNAERPFAELLDTLDHVDSATLSVLASQLARDVLGEDKLLRLLDRVFAKLTDVDAMCTLAEQCAYADPERGAALLLARWPDPSFMPARALALVVDWEAAPRRLGPYLLAAIDQAAAASDWDAVATCVEKSRRLLASDEQCRNLLVAGEALLESGDGARAADGFALIAEVVEDATARGDVDTAVRYVQALIGFAAVRADAALLEAASELKQRVSVAVEATAELGDWRRMRSDQQAERVAKHLRGKVLHLVGGQEEPWQAALAQRLGVGELRWHPTEKHESARQQWLSGLSADRDVVVVLWEFMGHAVSDAVKVRCRTAGVVQIEARTSERDIIEALDRHLNGE